MKWTIFLGFILVPFSYARYWKPFSYMNWKTKGYVIIIIIVIIIVIIIIIIIIFIIIFRVYYGERKLALSQWQTYLNL